MNRLKDEKSPYLLQHAGNPVDWRPWGEEAFAAARREDKPVFLSVGYSTCHWCHVMARESFEDPAVAEVLNRAFISVKVDREERPDVDAVYMAACTAMNGSGGWPLTALLTPEQKPFWAGTYLPRPQLLSLLGEAARLWREERDNAEAFGESLTERLRAGSEPLPGTPRRELAERGAASFARRFDANWGGFGGAPKFPAAHNLLFLLRYSALTGERRPREMAEITLERMYRGGIHDHVGGGFSRYSTDRRWLVPHFEKMLYDNALLSLAYTEAYHMTGRPVWRRAAEGTLDYVLRELAVPEGGFACGQDADSEGAEGKYYVFTRKELEELLGKDAEDFCRYYGVTEKGNFHGGRNVLNLIENDGWETEPEGMEPLRRRVYARRKERAPLRRDDKVLTSWNALMIAALARAAVVFDRGDYLDAAERAAAFIDTRLRDGRGALLARWRDGDAAHPGKLDDYAFLAWGLLELYEAAFRVEYLERAAETAEQLLARFFDGENGGFYPYASDGERLITRTKETYDGAMPSGNAAAGLALSRLWRLTGELRWRGTAEKQTAFLAGAAEEVPAGHGFALLCFLETLWPTEELVVTAAEPPAGWMRLLREGDRPNRTVLLKTAENARRLAAAAPFTADYPVPETGARYYLCHDGKCEAPVDRPERLRREPGGE